ncbi:thioredoxin family protein [Metabacillus fastidiosus]|uniref:thioredoxin family protein n=1 Tax=Metabacillus fastidiosus TaxID=1458 RepID=UPI003D2E73B6
MAKRIEIFTAGTYLCEDVIDSVKEMACSKCEIIVHDVRMSSGQKIAKTYNIESVPSIAIDKVLTDLKKGKLANFLHSKILNKLKLSNN